VCAYFSYRNGWKEGIYQGIHLVITDLAKNTIIKIYENEEDNEVIVGRYDVEVEEMKGDGRK
jgi:hypothetical protein